jgi:thymidylate synthase (FAD)
MNIVKPYARIFPEHGHAQFHLSDGEELLRKIEFCGRISHRSEDAQTHDSWKRFIEAVVIGHGDWSIVEHASVTVDFLVDRGITHELVRHRLFSFTQESTRFVNYEKKMPPSFIRPNFDNPLSERSWEVAIGRCEDTYKQLIADGCAPQIARSVFPNALASRIITTGNLRNWRHLMLLRTTKETHPQFREVTIPLLAEFKAKIPILFDDIEPLARQIDNMRKPR